MQKNSRKTVSAGKNKQNDRNFAVKTMLQSITALIIFLVIWGISVNKSPEITAFCDKIRHYLTHTVDVQSVFRPITTEQIEEVNEK